jgi:hypothetical protein
VIRGRFRRSGTRWRPIVDGTLYFASGSADGLDFEFLIDTGASRTILAPDDADRFARRFAIDLGTLRPGVPSVGVGGSAETWRVEISLRLDGFEIGAIPLTVLQPTPGRRVPIPSLLGRDILGRFALFIEERTDRVLPPEPEEADALAIRRHVRQAARSRRWSRPGAVVAGVGVGASPRAEPGVVEAPVAW